MKTLLLLAFASVTSPLRIVRNFQERFKKVHGLHVAWRNPDKPQVPCREMVNDPGYWDTDWFKNYE
jgi:hypothetical protein